MPENEKIKYREVRTVVVDESGLEGTNPFKNEPKPLSDDELKKIQIVGPNPLTIME
jgi:hypothetical protein